VISIRAWKTAQQPIRAPDQRDSGPFNLYNAIVRAEKSQELN
jgi:hypothetical protein